MISKIRIKNDVYLKTVTGIHNIFMVNQCQDTELLYEISHIILCRWTGTEMECSMDRQTVERRREYVQNIRNSFYEENGMQKRETREVDDSAPEMGLAAALKLRIFLSVCIFAAFLGCMYTHTDLCGCSTQTITEMICDNHYYTNLKNYVMIH